MVARAAVPRQQSRSRPRSYSLMLLFCVALKLRSLRIHLPHLCLTNPRSCPPLSIPLLSLSLSLREARPSGLRGKPGTGGHGHCSCRCLCVDVDTGYGGKQNGPCFRPALFFSTVQYPIKSTRLCGDSCCMCVLITNLLKCSNVTRGKQSTRVKAPSSWKRHINLYAINTAYNATIPLYAGFASRSSLSGLASRSSLSGREHAHP